MRVRAKDTGCRAHGLWVLLATLLSLWALPARAGEPLFPDLPRNRWVEVETRCVGGLESYFGGCPSGRGWIQLTYDTKRGKVVLFGGASEWYFNDLWYFDPRTLTWELILQDTRLAGVEKDWSVYPKGRDNHQMAYDPARDVYWMYGGTGGGGFWKFLPAAREWVRMPGENDNRQLPKARLDPAFALAPFRQEILLFGGERHSAHDETWLFDTAQETWRRLDVHPSPRARTQTENAMVYDTVHDQFILFGGRGKPKVLLGDTWIFDPDKRKWREATPEHSPPPRDRHAMAFDQKNGVAILLGGSDAADTWVYDPARNTWQEVISARGDYRARHAWVSSAVYLPDADLTMFRDRKGQVYLFRFDPDLPFDQPAAGPVHWKPS